MSNKSISVKQGMFIYRIFEGGTALSLIGFGMSFTMFELYHMVFFAISSVLCYGEAMMLSQQLGIVPFYYRWINKNKWSWRIEK